MLEYIAVDQFNFFEGCFWILLSLVCLYIYRKLQDVLLQKLALVSSVFLFLFGLSDFIQVAYGSFLVPGMEWLYVWKVVNVVGLVLMFMWYLYIRIRT